MPSAQFANPAHAGENFTYGAPASDAAGLRLAVSIFADRPHVREQMREDAEGAGFRIVEVSAMEALLDGDVRALGDVVLLDCPQMSPAVLAGLARLDLRAGHAGAELVVSTSVDALDDVFGALDQSAPQILVSPSRAERMIALGRVLARLPSRRVRELSEEDRLVLLRLTEQVSQIAERMDRMSPFAPPAAVAPAAPAAEGGAFRFEGHAPAQGQEAEARLLRSVRPALPDPRLVRRIIRQRQLRGRFFDGDLFADPAWDMLLDLAAARAEHTRVSVTSLCIASGVPPTTALRWIGQMTEAGLLERVEDETDRRRAFITLTEKATDAISRYFAELGEGVARII
jgi:DNA-binding transcriptional ArsR family regulator/DNA-binding NarL/FixJ family response regulator